MVASSTQALSYLLYSPGEVEEKRAEDGFWGENLYEVY